MTENVERVPADTLRSFCIEALEKLNVPREDAQIVANVLVEADLRGIDSHGVARMSRYVTGIQQGMMKPRANPKVVHETPCTEIGRAHV